MTIYRSLVISALGGSLALAASPTDSFGAAGSWIGSLINDTIAGAAKGFLQPGQPWHWSPGGSIPWWGGHGPGSHGCKQIQYRFPPGTNGPGTESAQRAEAVKQAYVSAWDEYAKYAFGADGFNPVAMTSEGDGSGGWGLIIIDGVDTAITMGLKDIADQQLAWIAAQDFTKTSTPQIDGFDTTIRLIAGLLSAHDLITSGKVPYALEYNREHVQACLNGARDLADLLSPIFDTTTGLPYFWLNTTTHTGFAGPSNTAVDGTIILEYHRLSDLTGDPKYRQQADKAEAWLINPQPPPVYPGLVGSNVDMDTGKFTNENAGWQSGIDSFFEYLIKSVVYDPTQEFAQDYQNFWTTAVESTIQHLAVHPYDHPELTFITILNDTGYPLWQMDDYSAFAGGNFLLGGAYLGREDFISLGLAFTDSCHSLYNSTASGLNPLSLGWYGPDNLSTEAIYNDNATYTGQLARQQADEHGYYIRYDIGSYVSGAFYTLYPEPIESMLYAWRISGDTRWQEYNWEVFQAIQRDAHRGAVAVSSLYNVSAPLGGDQFGDVPSYYFAETLKYLYLTFADPNLVSLDDFVFNTECHPFRIQRGTCSTPGSFPW